jgi:hypothetical protein
MGLSRSTQPDLREHVVVRLMGWCCLEKVVILMPCVIGPSSHLDLGQHSKSLSFTSSSTHSALIMEYFAGNKPLRRANGEFGLS